jgi:uncharacterized protein
MPMIVSELYIYPIKSCQGIKLDRAEVLEKGFAWDREMMVVTSRGKFLTQRQYPQLAKVRVSLKGEEVSLEVEDNRIPAITFTSTTIGNEIEVEIWNDNTIAIDQGDEVARWFNEVLELSRDKQCRLVRQSPRHPRSIQNYPAQSNKPVNFADGYPFLMAATASLTELNQRIVEIHQQPSQAIPMSRFRPNIVIETQQPFIEDTWRKIQVGEVIFNSIKPCSRCIITTIDQQSGVKNELREPLRTLGTFRQFGEQGVLFGEEMIPRNSGIVKVGDRLKVLELRD